MNKTAACAALAAALLALTGCASHPARPSAAELAKTATRTDLARSAGTVQNLQTGQVLRLGYPGDFDSAPALTALQLGIFRDDLRTVTLQPTGYLSDLDEITALEHGQLDAAYLDPVAAITAWQANTPGSLKIVAGATAAASELIARPGITSPAQLRGTRVEAPAGSTQAVALSQWLSRNHLTGHVSLDGSAVTTIGILEQFKKGAVAAAWEPAPLAQELTAAGGHVLASAPASPASVLVITQRYLTANPAAVRDLLTAQARACTELKTPAGREAAGQMLTALTGTKINTTELDAAFSHLSCSASISTAAMQAEAQRAAAAGITGPAASLSAIIDRTAATTSRNAGSKTSS